jgi:DNA polymerase-3 subunit delta
MPVLPSGRNIPEESIRPGYFFYGEEMFPAHQFIRELKTALFSPDNEGMSIERFTTTGTPWREIIDIARIIPFFFSPWRLLLVEADAEEDEELSPVEVKNIKGYFGSPTPRTVVIVLCPGRLPKSYPLSKLFSSLGPEAVLVQEFKPLKGKALLAWANEKLAALGKRASEEAVELLLEMAGSDLMRLSNEIDKISSYLGEKKLIEADDVGQISDWVRGYVEWELSASLEKGDLGQSLMILNKRFHESAKPEHVLYSLTAFFRDIQVAKAGLGEKRDRKEIFRELRPRISETMGRFYYDRLNEFFDAVEGLRQKDLTFLIVRLEQADLKIKTTDASPQELFESVIYEYFRLRSSGGAGFISRARG